MRVQMLAAVAAVALAATARADSLPAYAPQAGPAVVPNTAALPVTLPIDGTVSHKYNGHLATATRGFVMQSTGNYWCSSCPNNQNCNNGAGSFRADLGFAFGPAKSFFDPCGPRILPECNGGGKLGNGCKSCRTPILGRGPAGSWPHCTYDSYLNH